MNFLLLERAVPQASAVRAAALDHMSVMRGLSGAAGLGIVNASAALESLENGTWDTESVKADPEEFLSIIRDMAGLAKTSSEELQRRCLAEIEHMTLIIGLSADYERAAIHLAMSGLGDPPVAPATDLLSTASHLALVVDNGNPPPKR
ncbi:hypothetical protein ACJ41P_22745 [Azospirillum argentinense]|uniref:Uncharacterized protein n=1 Tax=Azospirillum argentinense TaxID=2970906 RepID=A0ABW8VF78_9PROT